ncbi:MAG: 2-dehydro-3-deoxy-6-phosphogalactonate aldolase [Pseudomonadota bacterium]
MNASIPLESRWHQCLARLPLVAILRGVQPHEVVDIGLALVEAGWCLIEVPLNSPNPLHSISRLREHVPQALIGAGTVLSVQEVREVKAAAGEWIVSPHFDPNVVRESVSQGLISVPGVSTPSEAFAALAAGAHGLKVFPAEMITPVVLKSWRSVLPPDRLLLPVGGVGADNLAAYRTAGASGAGFGSSLYKPGLSAQQVGERARQLAQAWSSAT